MKDKVIKINENRSIEKGWETLSEPMRAKLNKSIEQADAGLGISAKDAIRDIRAKYRLIA